MQVQGWPDSILRWTSSFRTDRFVKVRYPGAILKPKKLECGVPQGSPISPLLFILYLAEPMRSGNSISRFGYADDIGILSVGRTITDSADAAQREVGSLLKWARENAVSFDTEKSQVVQFNRRRHETPVGIQVNGTETMPAGQIK